MHDILAQLTQSTQATAEPLTMATLVEVMEKLRPQRTVICCPGDELAMRRAVSGLEAEGFRVEVKVSEFVRLGQAYVIDPRAIGGGVYA